MKMHFLCSHVPSLMILSCKTWFSSIHVSWWVRFSAESSENDSLENGFKQPLLISSEDKQQEEEDGDQEGDGSEEGLEDSQLPVTSISSAYRLLTPSVKVRHTWV